MNRIGFKMIDITVIRLTGLVILIPLYQLLLEIVLSLQRLILSELYIIMGHVIKSLI